MCFFVQVKILYDSIKEYKVYYSLYNVLKVIHLEEEIHVKVQFNHFSSNSVFIKDTLKLSIEYFMQVIPEDH